MRQRQVIVVGGGASGLVAAITAAREGALVTIIEQKDRLGKKILSTGNGRCNLTNEYMNLDYFRGDDTTIVSSILNQFGYTDTLKFFEELGVILKSRDGYIYPISDQAAAITDVLCMELKRLHVNVILEESVKEICKREQGFRVRTQKASYDSDAVILATGGMAAPILGSDGSGYSLAESFGHCISPVVPALVQLIGKGNYFKQIAGVRTNATVSVYVNNEFAAADTGELQLTNYGISGIPVFQISRFASKALYEKKMVTAEINFLPTMTESEVDEYLNHRKTLNGYKTAKEFFVGMFPEKLIGLFLRQANIPPHILAAEIREDKWELLKKLFQHFTIEIEGTNSFEQAQVCAGGVRTAEIKETLESVYADDLYLTGELLDIDGICGGYNLQWAWSTGYVAGKNAAKGK